VAARAGRLAQAQHWLRVPARRGFSFAPTYLGPTLRHDFDAVLTRLRAAGVRQIAHVDLTQPVFDVPVARLIVPGLEGPWTPPDGEYTPGTRARSVSA
jgi:ribosomal protein S12 methylthiotransferase accessory factor YcaO